jgi:hypothetical protein
MRAGSAVKLVCTTGLSAQPLVPRAPAATTAAAKVCFQIKLAALARAVCADDDTKLIRIVSDSVT